MPSRHLVDPQVISLVEQFPPFDLSHASLPDVRGQVLAMVGARDTKVEGVSVSERFIPGPAGAPDVRVLISRPSTEAANRPAILHLHGGGYVFGAPEQGLLTDAAYVTQLNAVVVAPAYRLAPETVHPGPVEDAYAALKWLSDNAADLGVDRRRIAVSGESAGGGLAAGLALLARDRGEIDLAFQHLVYPMLDDRTAVSPDPSPYHGQFVWTRENNLFGWGALLGGPPGGAEVSPYAAPARADDLSGLPPTYLACGALDLFLEEDLEYARRLVRAGVSTELHVYPGAPHAFMLVEGSTLAQAYARHSMTALKKAFGG